MTDRKLYVSDEIIARDGAEWWKDEEACDYSNRIIGDYTEIYEDTIIWQDDMGNIYVGTWKNWEEGGCYNDTENM